MKTCKFQIFIILDIEQILTSSHEKFDKSMFPPVIYMKVQIILTTYSHLHMKA